MEQIKNLTTEYKTWGLSGEENAIRLDDTGEAYDIYVDHGGPDEKWIGSMFATADGFEFHHASRFIPISSKCASIEMI